MGLLSDAFPLCRFVWLIWDAPTCYITRLGSCGSSGMPQPTDSLCHWVQCVARLRCPVHEFEWLGQDAPTKTPKAQWMVTPMTSNFSNLTIVTRNWARVSTRNWAHVTTRTWTRRKTDGRVCVARLMPRLVLLVPSGHVCNYGCEV